MKTALAFFAAAVAALTAAGSAKATVFTYYADLDGPSEAMPNNSPGIGTANVIYDDVAHTMEIFASFSDLLGTTTASHIHCCTAVPLTGAAGVATTTPSFPGFPLGVQSGDFHSIFDMTQAGSYNPNFLTAHPPDIATAEAFLFQGIAEGRAYFNIHSTEFPGGEIRGFLLVPEPATIALFGFGLLGLGASARRRRTQPR